MEFDENNIRTEWDDSLEGKEGYFSDYLDDNINGSLKKYVTNDGKGLFGIVTYSSNSEHPFTLCNGYSYKYFYPVDEIKTKDTEKKILFDKIKNVVLHCFEKTEDGESDHQCYNGEWYLPICGCDTLQDIIDSVEQEIIG